jgi:coenzyme F420-reducing hydrogenase delta subunit
MQSSALRNTSDALSPNQPVVTLFVCANGARSAERPSERNRRPPQKLHFDSPYTTYEVVLPCAGRLQPEHVLKAFEAGSDAVVVVACQTRNCHYHEGSQRCLRRVEYVGRILDDVGLGANRILYLQLPGSAREDLAAGDSTAATLSSGDRIRLPADLAELRARIIAHVAALPPDPIHRTIFPESATSELDDQDESEE